MLESFAGPSIARAAMAALFDIDEPTQAGHLALVQGALVEWSFGVVEDPFLQVALDSALILTSYSQIPL
jgi:hypothetical protein